MLIMSTFVFRLELVVTHWVAGIAAHNHHKYLQECYLLLMSSILSQFLQSNINTFNNKIWIMHYSCSTFAINFNIFLISFGSFYSISGFFNIRYGTFLFIIFKFNFNILFPRISIIFYNSIWFKLIFNIVTFTLLI